MLYANEIGDPGASALADVMEGGKLAKLQTLSLVWLFVILRLLRLLHLIATSLSRVCFMSPLAGGNEAIETCQTCRNPWARALASP